MALAAALSKRLCQLHQRCRVIQSVRWNSYRASVTRINRFIYPKMYPTVMVLPDGSTVNFRHSEPRKLVKLPLDLSKLSQEERALIMARRKPKEKVVVQEYVEDGFDANEYSHLWKKS